jgi:DNA-binding transcriptional MerR regulator
MDTQTRASESRHPIRVAAGRAGITPATLRAWERRYRAVDPVRSEAGQRLYSDEEVERLRKIRLLSEAGRAVSTVAGLGEEELDRLLAEDREATAPVLEPRGGAGETGVVVSESLEFIRRLEPDELDRTLRRACLEVGPFRFVDEILVPILVGIGEEWRAGQMGPASEHLASGVIRRIMEWLLRSLAVVNGAPLLLVGTPAGQVHEFGALMAGIVAAGAGWRVAYLGPDLPSEEIARGALGLGARAIALSALRTGHEEQIEVEVLRLRELLPERIDIFIGGPGTGMVGAGESEGIQGFSRFGDFRRFLESEL